MTLLEDKIDFIKVLLWSGVVVKRGYQWSKSQLLWQISWIFRGHLPLFRLGYVGLSLIGKWLMLWPSFSWESWRSSFGGRIFAFGLSLDLIRGFSYRSYFWHLLDPILPLVNPIFLHLWKVKVPKKVMFFVWQVVHDRVNTFSWLKIKDGHFSWVVLLHSLLEGGGRLLYAWFSVIYTSRLQGDDWRVLCPFTVSWEKKVFVASQGLCYVLCAMLWVGYLDVG